MLNKRKRILVLNGPVNDEMYKEVMRAVGSMDGNGRVKLYLNTPGGYLHDAFAIYDLLKLHFPKLTIISNGIVASAGTVILQAGDRRLALPNTEFLIHYGETSASSPAEVRANARAQKQMRQIIKNKVKVSGEKVNEWFEIESYFSAKGALRVGLIDEIIGEKK